MIPLIILYAVSRSKKDSFFSKTIAGFKKLSIRLRVLLLGLSITTLSHANKDPANIITYRVIRNNDVIGTIQIQREFGKDSTVYTLESDITAKFILKYNIEGKETSIYKNGVLVFSSVYRQINNKVKTDHEILLEDARYLSKSTNTKTPLHFGKIRANLITLYFKEPTGINKVFCDNEKRMVEIKQISNGVYKVLFDNGKYNVFHYKNGKCIRVEANSKLFSVQLIQV